MAKTWVNEAYRKVCALAHQCHGAIGFHDGARPSAFLPARPGGRVGLRGRRASQGACGRKPGNLIYGGKGLYLLQDPAGRA